MLAEPAFRIAIAASAAMDGAVCALAEALPHWPRVDSTTTQTWDAVLMLVDSAAPTPEAQQHWQHHAQCLCVLSPQRPQGWHHPQLHWIAAPVRLETLARSIHQHLQQTPLSLGGGTVFRVQHSPPMLHAAAASIELTPREASFLWALAQHPEGIPREDALAHWWDVSTEGIETHALETQLYRLRQKMTQLAPDGWALELRHGVCHLELTA